MVARSTSLSAFAAEMRRLQQESGRPSVRDLVALMRAAGQPYARSTIGDKLAGVSKPDWEFVAAFVHACARHRGERAASDPELARWRVRFTDLRRGGGVTTTSSVPRQLPGAVAGFAGRTDEIAALDRLLAATDPQRVALLSGTAGVGKTALAVAWAHRVADRFPDGQLYVDLCGYDPDAPVAPARALDGFLIALGLTGGQLPYETADKSARFRSLLAGRSMLIVLDNAYAADQVRALLPGDAGCVVVVTSRDALAGLVARHGATRIDVDQLPLTDALVLLRSLIGARVDADSAAAADLAERCARLPLALRIAAEYAAGHPRLGVRELVDGLAVERSLLDAFADEADERADVRAVFSWSYRRVPAPAARLFRLLAAHPVGPVSEPAMAALTGDDPATAAASIRVLASGHLIQAADATRWQMHDLLRAYSIDLFIDETDAERSAARTRLLDFYLASTAAALDLLFPAERAARGTVPHSPHAAAPTGAPAALRWLDDHRTTLVGCVDLAARFGHTEQVAQLSRLLWRYLDAGAHYADALTVHQAALVDARARGDRLAEGQVRTRIGIVYLRWGQHGAALRELTEALAASHRAGDVAAEAGSHNALGLLHTSLGEYEPAMEHLHLALDAARRTGSVTGAIATLDNIGRTHRLWGRLTLAVEFAHEALDASGADPVAFAVFEGKLLANLAATELIQGRLDEAGEHARGALARCDATGDVIGAAMARETIAWWHLRNGRVDAALTGFGALIDLQRDLGDPDGRASTRNGIGAARLHQRRFDAAADQFRRALRRAREDGDVTAQCESLNGLGRSALGVGDLDAALGHFGDAFELSTKIDEWYERARAARGTADAHQWRGDPDAASTWHDEALIWYARAGITAPDEPT